MNRIFITIVFLLSAFVLNAQTSHTCPSCNGKGSTIEQCTRCRNGAIYCTYCDYSGKISTRCGSCDGNGYTMKEKRAVCSSCNGRRYTQMEKQVSCSCRGGKRPMTSRDGRTTYVDCSRCSGRGYLIEYYNAACRNCGGSGYRGTEYVKEKCSSCYGKGSIESVCSRCNGNGAYKCNVCNGYENITRTCSRCRGTGRIYTN